MRVTLFGLASFGMVLAGAPVSAGEPPQKGMETSAPKQSAPAPVPRRHVPADTRVVIQLTEDVSSKDKKRGDKFNFRLAVPIVVDGDIVVPAGADGVGEVVESGPHKLVLVARSLTFEAEQIPLQGFNLVPSEPDKVAMAPMTPYVGLLSQAASGVRPPPIGGMLGWALAAQGGHVETPAGARATARLSTDLDLAVIRAAPAGSRSPPDATASAAGPKGAAPSLVQPAIGVEAQDNAELGWAIVNVYRLPSHSSVGYRKALISIDGVSLGEFSDNTCVIVKVATGEHDISSVFEAGRFDMSILKDRIGRRDHWSGGETYYYHFEDTLTLSGAMWVTSWKLLRIDPLRAAAEMGGGGCVVNSALAAKAGS